MFEGQSSHLPLKSTPRASSRRSSRLRCCCCDHVANFNSGQLPEWANSVIAQLSHGRPLFLVLYVALIVFFAFFYTAMCSIRRDGPTT